MSETLLSIARCVELKRCLEGATGDHPCGAIVAWQANGLRYETSSHQIPEAWSGQLASAPLLFLSSNPSYSAEEHYPDVSWEDADIVDFFENRFDKYMKDGCRFLQNDRGTYGRQTAFNRSVKSYAMALLKKENVVPGHDYALTEVVHCKTTKEYGVKAAMQMCIDRHLEPVLLASGAKCIVILGSVAARAIDQVFSTNRSSRIHPILLGNINRLLVFLPHPNAHQKRGPDLLTVDERDKIHAQLAS